MTQKTRNFLTALAASCIAISTAALADGTARADQKQSRAVPLSDSELDGITAGTVQKFQVILNNGNADVLKFHANRNLCVNCFGIGGEGKALHIIVVENPAQTIIRCSTPQFCF